MITSWSEIKLHSKFSESLVQEQEETPQDMTYWR